MSFFLILLLRQCEKWGRWSTIYW